MTPLVPAHQLLEGADGQNGPDAQRVYLQLSSANVFRS